MNPIYFKTIDIHEFGQMGLKDKKPIEKVESDGTIFVFQVL